MSLTLCISLLALLSFSSFISYFQVVLPSSLSLPLHFASNSLLFRPFPSLPLSLPTFLLFLSCSSCFFFGFCDPRVLPSRLAKGNSTTSTFEGSHFAGKIQFVLAVYLRVNHSEGFIYIKCEIRADWSHFPLSDCFSSHSSPLAEAMREMFSFLTFI